jgi:hypothetical protein
LNFQRILAVIVSAAAGSAVVFQSRDTVSRNSRAQQCGAAMNVTVPPGVPVETITVAVSVMLEPGFTPLGVALSVVVARQQLHLHTANFNCKGQRRYTAASCLGAMLGYLFFLLLVTLPFPPQLGVQSLHLMDWIESKSLWGLRPELAEVFVVREAFEGLESSGEVIGFEEVGQASFKLGRRLMPWRSRQR